MLYDSEKIILVTIQPQTLTDERALQDLQELKSLVEAYGGSVIDLVVQHREVHDKGSYIGAGKIAEVEELIKEKKADGVVLNAIVKASQLFDLKTTWYKSNPNIFVWDRIELILQIFSQHASTSEAKLQIELAAMRHMGPRIYGMGQVMSRQGGGIGTLGVGETNTELMKRHWRAQMKKTIDKLAKLTTDRERQIKRRERMGLKTISIIGYTNAGKSALFNKLTKKDKLVENALFATLDSNVGKVYFPTIKQEVLLSDTIGFIQNLPPSLINAFKSTLLETIHADLLFHVIDASDSDIANKLQVVQRILRDLSIADTNQIIIFNKSDRITSEQKAELQEKYAEYTPQFISAKSGEGIESLLKTAETFF